ncbi:MAG: hypothetical protein OSB20_10195 [Porticoccaceae bacterium]|nr:hypothetical protein [Porticoccaceae bacterium]
MTTDIGLGLHRARSTAWHILEFWSSGVLEFWSSGVLEFWGGQGR